MAQKRNQPQSMDGGTTPPRLPKLSLSPSTGLTRVVRRAATGRSKRRNQRQ